MGKESVPAQFFKATFIPEEEYGFEPPQEPTIHKSIPKCLRMCPTLPPTLARSDPANGCMVSPYPSWDPQLRRAVNSKPVPANGTPSLELSFN